MTRTAPRALSWSGCTYSYGFVLNVTVIIWPCLSPSSPSDKSESISCYINKPHYVIDTDVSVISCRRPDGLRCRFYISEIRNHLGVASRRDVTSRFSLSGMKYATVGPCAGSVTKLWLHCNCSLRRSAEPFYAFQSRLTVDKIKEQKGDIFEMFVSLLLILNDAEMSLMSRRNTLYTDPNCQIGISRSV